MVDGMKVSYSQIGSALGISKQAVGKLVKQGMPTDSISAARAWRVANLDVSRIKDSRQGGAPAAGVMDEGEPVEAEQGGALSDAYRSARTEREQIRRDRERLELQREQGLVVDAAEGARLRFTEFRVLRDCLINIGPRVAPMVAAETDSIKCERIYSDALNEALKAFADGVLTRGLLQDVDEEDDEAD